MPFDRPAALPIEDYAVIGDCMTAALVARDGSIDWLCWPRFDSAACFAALLGGPEHGHYQIAPAACSRPATRQYRDGGLVLETLFTTDAGQVALIDFMVPGAPNSSVIRIVEGRSGTVDMRMVLRLRFDYGLSVPWVTKRPGGNGIVAIAGPEMVVLRTDVRLRGENLTTVSDFTVSEGQRISFVLTRCPSHLPLPLSLDPEDALYQTEQHWRSWSRGGTYDGEWGEAVRRSLLTLKCLTYAETGGIVAAPTTSLPERLGGVRNWDYRFCWLRDATLTLFAFLGAGHHDEATAWGAWLHRSVAGAPEQVQIMYGIAGERRLEEWEIDWLPGYQGAKPVRIGNAAAQQLQLDVYGELCSALHQARKERLLIDGDTWPLQCKLLEHLEAIWRDPDEGLWETRGGAQQFTFSKVMAWLAFTRAIDDAQSCGLEAPVERW
ncbi:MAG: glycoside hydrolase family 15 protein, partial [Acetobacteraceae bacterium]|nr:glycoside hydrolase family 15 protein [Acetobacteraceae bacterium]